MKREPSRDSLRQDILNLAAIVLLRTLLNYFLEREIMQGEQSRQEHS
jgi:uncharacterized membrane protein